MNGDTKRLLMGALCFTLSCAQTHAPDEGPRERTYSLTVSGTSARWAVGQSAQLQAALVDSNGAPFVGLMTMAWSSSNPAVVSVTESGRLTALAVGAATITARATQLDTGAVASATIAAVVTASADTEPPSMPQAVTATSPSGSTVRLEWVASTDNVAVTTYFIDRDGHRVGTTSTNSYADTGLQPATSYGYSVSAADAAGNVSAPSPVVQVTTLAVAPPPSGLVAAFGLNEGGGNVVNDGSGHGHHGTMQGAQWGPGVNGGALVFANTGLVSMGDVTELDRLGALTVSAWVKTSSTPEKHAVDKSHCDGSGVFEFGTGFFTPGRATFLVYSASGNPSYAYVESAASVADGAWHFLAATFDGDNLRIFVDGVLSATSAAHLALASTSDAFELGGHCNGHSYPWVGALDDVRLYSRALSLAEVQADQATPLGGEPVGGGAGGGGGSGGGGAGGGGGSDGGAGGGGGSFDFFTTFAVDENPISEGGAWQHLATAWQQVRTQGGHAGPTVNSAGGASSGPPFDDSYAHLSGFAADQEVEVTIYKGDATAGEAEILLRVTDTASSVRCYELLYNIQGSAEIVRWNGPLNDFEENPAGTTVYPSPPGAVNGDKLRGRIVGNVIEFWFVPSTGPQAGVPHLLATLDDQSSRRVTSGQPGMAFFQRANSGEPAGSLDYGFADYAARSLP